MTSASLSVAKAVKQSENWNQNLWNLHNTVNQGYLPILPYFSFFISSFLFSYLSFVPSSLTTPFPSLPFIPCFPLSTFLPFLLSLPSFLPSLSFPSQFPPYWFCFSSPLPLSLSVNHHLDSSICTHSHQSHTHTHTHTHTHIHSQFINVSLSLLSCSLMLSLSVCSLSISTLFFSLFTAC